MIVHESRWRERSRTAATPTLGQSLRRSSGKLVRLKFPFFSDEGAHILGSREDCESGCRSSREGKQDTLGKLPTPDLVAILTHKPVRSEIPGQGKHMSISKSLSPCIPHTVSCHRCSGKDTMMTRIRELYLSLISLLSTHCTLATKTRTTRKLQLMPGAPARLLETDGHRRA